MKTGERFEQLLALMARLRAPGGCMWDRQQTHASLRPYLLEETYEVLETIDQSNYEELGQELGDLLLQVIFHAQIAAETSRFDINTVIDNLSRKLIRRHPHVFGDEKIGSVAELRQRWEEIKKSEGKKPVNQGVPTALPALQRAVRLQQKAHAPLPSWEELEVLCRTLKTIGTSEEREGRAGREERLQHAVGDLLFALAAASQAAGVNPEDALRETCLRFQQNMEEPR